MYNGVLFISTNRAEAGRLSRMLAPVSLHLDHARSLIEARARLGRHTYSAILTEASLPDGSWRDVLDMSGDLPWPCAVIVTDRVADDAFWAEILNLGAYDLLAQPFDCCEVQRIIESACRQARQPAMEARQVQRVSVASVAS